MVLTNGSAHQLERIGEKLRTAEIAGFQRQQHLAVLGADGTQHRHPGGNLHPHQKAGDPQAIHHRAGGFAARRAKRLVAGVAN